MKDINKKKTSISVNNDIVLQATKLESFMLPPNFRKRSIWTQRLKVIMILMINAIAIGMDTYILIGGIKEKIGIYETPQTIYFIIANVVMILSLAISAFYNYWIKSLPYTIKWSEFILFLISPIIAIAGIIYIDTFNTSTMTLHKFLEYMGYIVAGIIVIPTILGLLNSLLQTKTYRESKYRAIYLLIGTLITSPAVYLIYFMSKNKTLEEVDVTVISIALGVLFGGVVLIALGVFFSLKYVMSVKKNIWYPIRYTSALPWIVVFTTIIGFTVRLALKASFTNIMIMQLALQLFILMLFIGFLFFKARIKNMHNANPLYNEVWLKIFIIFEVLITFIVIYMMPSLLKVKSFAPHAFAMALCGSIIIIIGILCSHFMNLITYNKYRQVSYSSTIITNVLIVGVAIVIASLKQAEIMTEILGRQMIITMLLFTIIFLGIEVLLNLVYVLVNSVQSKKKIKIDTDIIGNDNLNISTNNVVEKGSK